MADSRDIQNHTITVKGLTVYYRTAGDPKNPPLILLNGWGVRLGGIVYPSNKVIAEFAQSGFFVYSPEHPGLMRSQTPSAPWNFEDYADYLQELILKLNVINPVIVGQSFGGAIATAYAARHPETIQTLVLVCAGLGKGYAGRFRILKQSLAPTYLGILASPWFPKIFKKISVWLALGVPWAHISRESYDIRAMMAVIFKKWFLPDLYAKISCPSLFIWGSRDVLFPPSQAKRAAGNVPHVKFIVISGGHSVLYIKTKDTVECIVKNIRIHRGFDSK